MQRALFFFAFALAACDVGNDEPPRDPTASVYLSATPTEDQIARVEVGAPCRGPTFPVSICGAKNRIAGVYVSRGDRSGPSPIFMPSTKRDVKIEGTRIAVKSDCPECNIAAAWEFHGDLALMTAAEQRDLQDRLGLPEAPLLSTTDEWNAAFGAAMR